MKIELKTARCLPVSPQTWSKPPQPAQTSWEPARTWSSRPGLFEVARSWPNPAKEAGRSGPDMGRLRELRMESTTTPELGRSRRQHGGMSSGRCPRDEMGRAGSERSPAPIRRGHDLGATQDVCGVPAQDRVVPGSPDLHWLARHVLGSSVGTSGQLPPPHVSEVDRGVARDWPDVWRGVRSHGEARRAQT